MRTVSCSNEGRGWEAGALHSQPFPKAGYFVERQAGRRTDKVIGTWGLDCATGYCKPTGIDFITDQRPPGERESLAGFGGTYNGDRVVECRARARPDVAGASFQQPGRPRLIRAVEQFVALQIAALGNGPLLLQQLGRANRHQPLIE